MTAAWWLFYLTCLSMCLSAICPATAEGSSRALTWLQGSRGLGEAGRGRPASSWCGGTCSWLKVSLDVAGLQTCFFHPVPGGHRSPFWAKDKAQNRTRPSTIDQDLPYLNNGSKRCQTLMRLKGQGWGALRLVGGRLGQRTKLVSRAEQAWCLGHRQDHRRLKVLQADRGVWAMEVCCQWLPVRGLIGVLLGSPPTGRL